MIITFGGTISLSEYIHDIEPTYLEENIYY